MCMLYKDQYTFWYLAQFLQSEMFHTKTEEKILTQHVQ